MTWRFLRKWLFLNTILLTLFLFLFLSSVCQSVFLSYWGWFPAYPECYSKSSGPSCPSKRSLVTHPKVPKWQLLAQSRAKRINTLGRGTNKGVQLSPSLASGPCHEVQIEDGLGQRVRDRRILGQTVVLVTPVSAQVLQGGLLQWYCVLSCLHLNLVLGRR